MICKRAARGCKSPGNRDTAELQMAAGELQLSRKWLQVNRKLQMAADEL